MQPSKDNLGPSWWFEAFPKPLGHWSLLVRSKTSPSYGSLSLVKTSSPPRRDTEAITQLHIGREEGVIGDADIWRRGRSVGCLQTVMKAVGGRKPKSPKGGLYTVDVFVSSLPTCEKSQTRLVSKKTQKCVLLILQALKPLL